MCKREKGKVVRVHPRAPGMPQSVQTPLPQYCKRQVLDGLDRRVVERGLSKAFDFGLYAAVPQAHAVKGLGLVACEKLAMVLLTVAPFARLLYTVRSANLQPQTSAHDFLT